MNLDFLEARIREILPAAWPVEKDQEVWEWAKENVRLRGSPYGDIFDADETPWLKEPMRAWRDRATEMITISCCAQWGKTTIETICASYALAKDPGPMLCCVQTVDEAKNFSTEKIMPVLESVEVLKGMLPKNRNKKAKLKIEWPWGSFLIGAANPSFLRGHSMRYLIGDELSQWRAGMRSQFLARSTRFFNRKVMMASTPLHAGDEHHASYLAGTQELFHVPCQSCGVLMYPQIKDGENRYLMIWDDTPETRDKASGIWKPELAAKTARLRCLGCGHEHHQTPEMWRAMVNGGRYVATNADGTAKHRSFKSNAFILPPSVMSWKSLVAEYLSALNASARGFNQPLKEFITLRLADPWIEGMDIGVSDLVLSNYSPTEPWPDETHRFMTIDCQHELESFWWVVRAWDKRTGASRRLGFGSATSFDALEKIQESFAVPSHRVGVDCGYEMYRVFAECIKRNWIALRGDDAESFVHGVGKAAKKRPYSTPGKGDPRSGKSDAGRTFCHVFRWSNPSVKDALFRLMRGKGVPWQVATTGDVALDAEYARQMDSERKKVKTDAHGRIVTYFERFRDNHALDCEAMNTTLAMIVGCLMEEGVTTEEKTDNAKN